MRELGYSEKEIDAKLPIEPVQKTGFQFGAVMGKRLIDYGIMSSSTDSEDEDALNDVSDELEFPNTIKTVN